MIIFLHVALGISSILYITYAFFLPTKSKIRNTYVLIGATIGSGTYLVISRSAHLIQACTTGLVYLVAMSFGIYATHYRLVNKLEKQKNIKD